MEKTRKTAVKKKIPTPKLLRREIEE